MAFTFVEIEERRTRNLTALFGVLVGLYLASLSGFVWLARLIANTESAWTWRHSGMLLLLATGLAGLHWISAIPRLIDRVLIVLMAQPLVPEDRYHQQFRNVVEEVGIAVGGRYQITPYVIPTTALNACAVANFNREAALIVTEGLLARLSRAQLQAVVGHEAAHIARGDSLATTVFCGLFGIHEEALRRATGLLSGPLDEDESQTVLPSWLVVTAVAPLVLWIVVTVKRACAMAISREQEYRADAVAVRLTRNPLALAEALRIISRRWRGVGAFGESLSTIFILDQGAEALSEQEGLIADLFSTHPPIRRRLEALCGMAHVEPAMFEKAMAAQVGRCRPRTLAAPEPLQDGPVEGRWHLWAGEEWQGPFDATQLKTLGTVTPDTWVRREGADRATLASQDPGVFRLLEERYARNGPGEEPSGWQCPNCRVGLQRVLYEGTPLDECPACRGCYVSTDQLRRVLAREEYEFSESVKRMAQLIPDLRARLRVNPAYQERHFEPIRERQCPKCCSAVLRKFYSIAYLVEVEQCWACGLTWLDRGELELIQYLYEESEDDPT